MANAPAVISRVCNEHVEGGARPYLALFLATVFAFSAVGCSDERSQALEEELTKLQKQLSEDKAELQRNRDALAAANEELARSRSRPAATLTPPPATHNEKLAVNPEELKQSYAAAGKSLLAQLRQSANGGIVVEGCVLHRIENRRDDYPVSASISVRLRSQDGRQFIVDLPAKATAKGEWLMPTTAEIFGRVQNAGAPSAAVAAQAPQQTQQVTSQPITAQGGRSVTIEWPEAQGARSAAPAQAQAQPPVAAAPQAARSSTPVASAVKSDREVTIDW